MMVSLFSVFDPVSLGGQWNWVSVVMPFVLVMGGYYMVVGGVIKVLGVFLESAVGGFKELGSPNGRAVVVVVAGLFVFLMWSNLLGLAPFVFTHTAHPLITLGLGVVGWLMCFVMGWVGSFKVCAGHLVPEGCPLVLAPVLVLIESISHLIRPFTLSVRLAANMMAGHLIVGLLAILSEGGWGGVVVSVVLQSLLLLLEFGVAIIQGLVFSILLLLYVVEYY